MTWYGLVSPIRRALLNIILEKFNIIFGGQPYLLLLYRALFSTAYFGLFRVGELTLSDHVVRASNVHIATNKKKLMFILFTSKTHGMNVKPQTIKITSEKVKDSSRGSKDYSFCPFYLLQQYLLIRNKALVKDEQFFVFRDNSPVKPEHMRSVLRLALKEIDLDTKLYTVHGLRGGRAVDLVEDFKISVQTVMKLGRWTSNAVYAYIK